MDNQKSPRSARRFSSWLITLLVLFCMAALPVSAAASSIVIPPNQKVNGFTYAQWSVKWWQWAFSLPVDQNPMFDDTGALCGSGQSGPVWFLAGTINVSGQVERNCTVPAKTKIMFPVVNVECADFETPDPPYPYDQLPSCAIDTANYFTSLSVTVDGVPVKNLGKYRFESGYFTAGPLPDNNWEQYFGYNAPEGTVGWAYGDGYYIILSPLAPGKTHTLHWSGEWPGVFSQDITYHINVSK